MNIYVTGQAGEVGSFVTMRLSDLKLNVIHSENEIPSDKNLRIIHTAAKHRGDATYKLLNSNIDYFYSIVKISKQQKNSDFIFCSSVSIYSEKSFGKINEKNELYSNDIYALTKLLGEQILIKENINSLILRLPSVLETKNNNNFMSRTLNSLMRDETIDIINGNNLFNGFVDPEDIAKFCSDIPPIKYGSEIYNFATHPVLTLNTIINLLKEMTKSKSTINNKDVILQPKIYSIDKLNKTGFKISKTEDSLEKWVKRKITKIS